MKDRKKFNSEKASATLIVFVTVFFILIILGTILTTAYLKRRAQLVDLMDLKDAYDGDLEEAYNDRFDYIGKYVDYTPDTNTYSKDKLGVNFTGSSSNTEDFTTGEYTDGWRILDYDKTTGEMTIVMATQAKDLYLSGARGYNNGVDILNDMCAKLYSNSAWNVTARSMKIEDIEEKFSDEGKETRNAYKSFGDNLTLYGDTKDYDDTNKGSYSTNRKYPTLYAKEKGSGTAGNGTVKSTGLGWSTRNPDGINSNASDAQFGETPDKLTVTQTYYNISWKNNRFKNKEYYNVIMGSTHHWLASRYVTCSKNNAVFGIYGSGSAHIGGDLLYDSTGFGLLYSKRGLRAVVELGPGIKVDTSTSGLDKEHQYHISK